MSTAPSNEIVNDTLAQAKPPFLRRVRIRGYKSIAFCDVALEPLTILVGRNASGKSNFLDALAFLRDVVGKGVHEAVKLHGGRDSILCQFAFSSFLSLEIEAGYQPLGEEEPWVGLFAVEIAMPDKGPPILVSERLKLFSTKGVRSTGYTVKSGRVDWSGDSYAHGVPEWLNFDRTLLGMYRFTPFLGLLEGIESIQSYNFNPDAIRRPQKPAPGEFLDRDGRNIASVLETTREVEEWAIERAGRYLHAITQSAGFAGVIRSGGYETLQFRVTVRPYPDENIAARMELPAASMSDGTLRVFAALVAAFQIVPPHGSPSIVAIEEPETSLHPAAMRALVDALDEATLRTQILLTTHSAEMLDNPTIRPENVRVVQVIDGRTVIGPVDEASVEIVRQKLDTLGGLERQNQLEPDFDDQERQQHLGRNGLGQQG